MSIQNWIPKGIHSLCLVR